MKKVVIQGIRGAFHEEAAHQWFGTNIEIVPELLFKNLVERVATGQSEYAMMAIENTLSGTIHGNLRLIAENEVEICGEVNLKIEQNLGVLNGFKLAELIEVRSHYMALEQCRSYFKDYPHIKLVEVADTALAAQQIANEKLERVGAIGSIKAIEHYGLNLLASGIQNNKENYTRFVVLQKKAADKEPTYNKVSLNIVLPHKPGSLARLLNAFADYGLDLVKLESIPIIGQPYHYQFIMDVLIDDPGAFDQAFAKAKDLTEKCVILGKYKSAVQ